LLSGKNSGFSIDGNDNLDLNGEYSKKEITILDVKYEKECRLGMGCAMVAPLLLGGRFVSSVGRRCKSFD
jgi:hypothetical protein